MRKWRSCSALVGRCDGDVGRVSTGRRRRVQHAGFQSICNAPPPPTSSRTRIVQHVSTHRNTHIRPEVVRWTPSCDPAPLTTSFETVGQWERWHRTMAGSEHPHSPRNATAHRAAQTILHLPQWSRAKYDVAASLSVWIPRLYFLVPPRDLPE